MADLDDSRPRAVSETLAIPQAMRDAIDERDGLHCRVCGAWCGEQRAIHHIIYGGDARGMGGRRQHVIEEMVTVCWLPWSNRCHDKVHTFKFRYQPLLLEVVKRRGVTVNQLMRWQSAGQRKRRRAEG